MSAPPAEEDELVEPGSDLDEMAAKVLRGTFKASPALVVSLIFHGAIFSLLPLVVFYEHLREPSSTPVTIGVSAQRIDPERNYKPVSGGPPAFDGRGLDDPPVYFPDALPAERNESESKVDRSRIEGDQQAVLLHTTNEEMSGARGRRNELMQFGRHDSIGVGGGSGRGSLRFGGEGGGRRNLAARGGGSAATEQAVDWGLAWLARHQAPNGSFPTETLRCGHCKHVAELKRCDVAATALAVDAFLTAGYTPSSRAASGRALDYPLTLHAGLEWLIARQKADGLVGEPAWGQEGGWPTVLYGHAFATMALCDAARLTSASGGAAYRKAATAAVKWLEEARSRDAGWQYTPRGSSDVSVTGACVQALRAASLARIPVQQETLAGVKRFFKLVTDEKGRAGYMNAGDAADRPALTAIALYTRRFLGESGLDGEDLRDAREWLAKSVIPKSGTDYYDDYYTMLALFEVEGPQGKAFKRANEKVTTLLVQKQHRPTDGCSAGSWDVTGDIYMTMSGRMVATAFNVLTLEVYYRYALEKSSSR